MVQYKIIDEYVNNLITENNHIQEKFSPNVLFRKYSEKLSESVFKFLKMGANVFAGTVIGAIVGTVYLKTTQPLIFAKNLFNEDVLNSVSKYLTTISTKTGDKQTADPAIIEKIKMNMEVVKANLGEPAVYGAIVIGIVTALSFSYLVNRKGKDKKEAKQEIRFMLNRNKKLNKEQQKVCKLLADKVYND